MSHTKTSFHFSCPATSGLVAVGLLPSRVLGRYVFTLNISQGLDEHRAAPSKRSCVLASKVEAGSSSNLPLSM